MRSLIKQLSVTIAMLLALNVNCIAQELIASNVSKTYKDAVELPSIVNIHTANLVSLTTEKNLDNPASNVYSDWTNASVRNVAGSLEGDYKIDLREFVMPTTSHTITSHYGKCRGRMHEGLDIKVYKGDTIFSAFAGKVRVVKYNPRGWGYYVVIRHPNGLETLYGHLSKQLVVENQIVNAGEPIGLGGNSGRSSGSHLHFETRVLGESLNPELLFDFPMQDIKADFYTLKCNK